MSMQRWILTLLAVGLIGPSIGYAQLTPNVVARAVADECYNGFGQPYVPIEDCASVDGGIPKKNHAYVWGMAKCDDKLWIGTGANVSCQAFTTVGLGGFEQKFGSTPIWACEGIESQFPGIPEIIRPFYGDWRPPRLWVHCTDADEEVNQELVEFDDMLVELTLGYRAVGAHDGVVIVAGPSLIGLGIHMFAFCCETREFLGSRVYPQYANIRKFVVHDGVMYCGVQNSIEGGSILRWHGNKHRPFRFSVVGRVDNEVSNLAVHEGRLCAATWPPSPLSTLNSTLALLTGADVNPGGVWVSPPIPRNGLNTLHTFFWKQIWNSEDYEPDPVLDTSYGVGDLRSFGGYLWWGTMQPPLGGSQPIFQAYGTPEDDDDLDAVEDNSDRRTMIFRASNIGKRRSKPKIELCYGEAQLPVFTPAEPDSGEYGTWELQDNLMGGVEPLFGEQGFGSSNRYTWVMGVFCDQLYVGTLGSDIWCFPDADTPAVRITSNSFGNSAVIGFRTIVTCPDAMYLGTASPLNLADFGSSFRGGWEVICVRKDED